MNRNILQRSLLGAALLLAALSMSTANAQSSQALDVTATVPSVCVIDGPGTDATLAFDLSALDVAVADFTASANFSWRCSLNTVIAITIDTGGSGSFTDRNMAGPGPGLNYNLYTDATLADVWGDGTGGSLVVNESGLGMTTVGTSVIEGRVLLADAQVAAVGSYSDTVTVTLNP